MIERNLRKEDNFAQPQTDEPIQENPLLSVLAAIFRHAGQHRDLYMVMLGSKGSAALTTKVQDWLAADFVKEIEHFSLAPNHKSVPLNISAQIITGALTRLILWWLKTENEYSSDQMAALFYQSLASGMGFKAVN
jgi:hypothetical protein